MTIRDFSGRCHPAVSRIRGVIDPRHALALGVLLLMLTAIVISSVTAADSPDEDVVLIEDFDDDSTPDVLIGDPSGETGDYNSPGEVEMMLSGGFDEFDNIIFRGETAGDQFGKDVAAADFTGNGLLDLIVGAPFAEVERSDGTIVTDGAAYIFYSPYQTDENGMLYARDADMRVESFFGDADERFGSRVAPLFDITGNGRPEIRTLSYADEDFIDLLGGEQITHIYDGETGEFLFAFVTDPDEFDPWQPFPGDVNGDGAVTQDDIDIIMANMGMEGPGVTRFDGDLNGDGVVDALDLGIALDQIGLYQFEVEWGEDIEPLVVIPGVGSVSPWRIPTAPGGDCLIETPGGTGMCCGCCGIAGCDSRCGGGGGGGPGTGDPCIDEGPCSPNCSERFCNPTCADGSGGYYGPCHEQCPDRACNAGCGFDDDFNPYGKCHPQCGLLPSCHALCEPECKTACGGDPCAAGCSERDCNPACGGDPCSPNCWKADCNPDCGGDQCSQDCDWAPCIIDCDGDKCAAGCPDRSCNPMCGTGDPFCDPACGGDPNNPGCGDDDGGGGGGDPPGGGGGGDACDGIVNPWCDPACGGDLSNPGCGGGGGSSECDGQAACPWSTRTYCRPWVSGCQQGWFGGWNSWCFLGCQDGCEPGEWTWSVQGSAEIVTEPNPPDADILHMPYVAVEFGDPGAAALILSNGCCTYKREFDVVNVAVDLSIDTNNVHGMNPPPSNQPDVAEGHPGKFILVEDDDLTPIRLSLATGGNEEGTWRLTYPSTRVTVWETPEGTEQVASGQSHQLPLPDLLYIEGVGPSSTRADVQLTLTVTVENNGSNVSCLDYAQATTFVLAFVGRNYDVAVESNGLPANGSGDANVIIPPDECVDVSNFVTAGANAGWGTGVSLLYASASGDPSNFRIHLDNAGHDGQPRARIKTFRIVNGQEQQINSSGLEPLSYANPNNPNARRSRFIRLVSDAIDKGGQPNRPLVQLGDLARIHYEPRYQDAEGNWINVNHEYTMTRVVGLPPGQGDNHAENLRRHDIRALKVRVHVFDAPNGQPSIHAGAVQTDIDRLGERLAQSTIRVELVGISNHPLPQELQNGLHVSAAEVNGELEFQQFNDGELHIANLNATDSVLDVFYLKGITHQGNLQLGVAYTKAANQTGNPSGHNFVVLNTDESQTYPFLLGHEAMHILLNSGHRAPPLPPPHDPLTSLFHKTISGGNSIGANKRIGPNANTEPVDAAGHDDTFTIREVVETLP